MSFFGDTIDTTKDGIEQCLKTGVFKECHKQR